MCALQPFEIICGAQTVEVSVFYMLKCELINSIFTVKNKCFNLLFSLLGFTTVELLCPLSSIQGVMPPQAENKGCFKSDRARSPLTALAGAEGSLPYGRAKKTHLS